MAQSKTDFENTITEFSRRWAKDRGVPDPGIDLYGTTEWGTRYGWKFLNHVISVGSGEQVHTVPSTNSVFDYTDENPLDQEATFQHVHTLEYKSKKSWSVQGAVSGGWGNGDLPGWNVTVSFEAGHGEEAEETKTQTITRDYVIPPHQMIRTRQLVSTSLDTWVFSTSVVVDGGVAFNFNPPVAPANGDDPDDKHHFWWYPIGTIMNMAQSAGYGPANMEAAWPGLIVTYNGTVTLLNASTTQIAVKPEFFQLKPTASGTWTAGPKVNSYTSTYKVHPDMKGISKDPESAS